LARYREAFGTSGAKDDPLDSELLLDLVVRHRCWKQRRPYDEDTYIDALRRRGSPLAKNLA
jgi:hypothetical protein